MPDCTNIKSVFIHRPKLKAEYFPNLNLRSKQTSLYSLPSERHIFSSPVIPVSQPHDQCVHWGSDSSELCWESMSWSSFSKTNCRAESAPRASDTITIFHFKNVYDCLGLSHKPHIVDLQCWFSHLSDWQETHQGSGLQWWRDFCENPDWLVKNL